jgi:hypothetical protein
MEACCCPAGESVRSEKTDRKARVEVDLLREQRFLGGPKLGTRNNGPSRTT